MESPWLFMFGKLHAFEPSRLPMPSSLRGSPHTAGHEYVYINNKTRHTDIHYMNDNIEYMRVASSRHSSQDARGIPLRNETHRRLLRLKRFTYTINLDQYRSLLGTNSLLGAPYWPEVMNIYTYYQT